MLHSFSVDTTIAAPDHSFDTRHAYTIYMSTFLPGENSFTVWTSYTINSYTRVGGEFNSLELTTTETYSEHFTDYLEGKEAFNHQCLRAVSAIMAGIVPLTALA